MSDVALAKIQINAYWRNDGEADLHIDCHVPCCTWDFHSGTDESPHYGGISLGELLKLAAHDCPSRRRLSDVIPKVGDVIAVPPEPPNILAVTDHDGTLWRRDDDGYRPHEERRLLAVDWAYLTDFMPLTVVALRPAGDAADGADLDGGTENDA